MTGLIVVVVCCAPVGVKDNHIKHWNICVYSRKQIQRFLQIPLLLSTSAVLRVALLFRNNSLLKKKERCYCPFEC